METLRSAVWLSRETQTDRGDAGGSAIRWIPDLLEYLRDETGVYIIYPISYRYALANRG